MFRKLSSATSQLQQHLNAESVETADSWIGNRQERDDCERYQLRYVVFKCRFA